MALQVTAQQIIAMRDAYRYYPACETGCGEYQLCCAAFIRPYARMLSAAIVPLLPSVRG